MKTIIAICGAIVLLLAPLYRSIDSRFGDEIVITTAVDGDLYLAASKVTINAPVRGDLVVAATTVVINDSVTQDVLVAGGNVMVNGHIGDDIRAAAGSITILGNVDGDVVVGSGELVLKRDAIINGNLTGAGGIFEIPGHVKGDIKITADNLKFSGVVDGELNARANEMELAGSVNGFSAISANILHILPGTEFRKDVRYWNDDGTLDISNETNNISVTYDPSIKVERPRWELLGYSSVLMVLWYLGTALLVIWLIEYLFSKTLLNAAGVAFQQSLGSMGYGILFFIGVPVLCGLLVVTLIALPVALIGLLLYGVVLLCATAVTAIVISNWLNRIYYSSSWNVGKTTLVAFGIFIALKFFTLTPVIGPTIMVILACMAIGAILISACNARRDSVAK